jgi:Protein of unknown function (DUF2877)
MNRELRANSIGCRAVDLLRSGLTGRMLASFPRVFNLVTDGGDVVVLAWGGVEKGPLTVLLDFGAASAKGAELVVGTAFRVGKRVILLSSSDAPLRVDFGGAVPWDPRPHWEALYPRREQDRRGVRIVSRILAPTRHPKSGARWGLRLRQAANAVQGAHLRRNREEPRASVQDLCGLGEGLAPQGDDWLAGWLLGLRLAQSPDRTGNATEPPGALVLDVAATHTTLLSRAFLACAAAGEATESQHRLQGQTARDPEDERGIDGATRAILAHGATSGAAMLRGSCRDWASREAP